MKWESGLTRREMLVRLSWSGIILAGGLTLLPLAKYFTSEEDEVRSPFVAFNKPVEKNSDWQNIPDSRVWIKRDEIGVMALVATCSHLGCEVRYYADKQRWQCPCHGSIYDQQGNPISGPALQALSYVAVNLKSDGSLLINISKQVGMNARAKISE